MSNASLTVHVRAESDLTAALLATGDAARRAGFDDKGRTALMTVVMELGRNLIKYAGDGRITLTPIGGGDRRGLEVVVTDRGPGIADVKQAMQDHFSTGGTLGLGLPGARRLMDEFEITSTPGQGTRVVARKWA